MPQSFEKVLLHIVFSTKNRAPFLSSEPERNEVHAYIGGIVKHLHSTPLSIGGTADHVHIFCAISRSVTIADLVRNVKTGTTMKLKTTISDFHWQDGYAVFSVSYSQREKVIAYINSQEEHHRSLSFQDELRTLLKKHEVELDERYAWG
ncbi:MAG: transposase [Thermoguttaceae bacterium]